MTKEQKYTMEIHEVIAQLFDKESDNYKYDLENVDLTAFFTGMILEFNYLYRLLSEVDGDLIDTVSLINRLTHQYLNKKEETNV